MNRVNWIDNLRITVIILVVILHTAVTYSGLGGWYYKENEEVEMYSTLFFAFYLTFTQAYFMSLLFMVSGYFTQRSLLRKGSGNFVRSRLFRLGIPLLIVNHATAELPGMMAMVGYIERHFPGVPVKYLPGEFPCSIVK